MRTTINSKGVTVQDGTGGVVIELNGRNRGFLPFAQPGAIPLTASVDLANLGAGVFTMSGTAALTGTLPAAASSVGMMLTFRAASAHAHKLTSSAETAGTKVICNSTANGSALALPAVVGSSVSLLCDGVNWQIIGVSGSMTVSGA